MSVRNVNLKDARITVMHGYNSWEIKNEKSFVSYREFAYDFESVILK